MECPSCKKEVDKLIMKASQTEKGFRCKDCWNPNRIMPVIMFGMKPLPAQEVAKRYAIGEELGLEFCNKKAMCL